MKTNAFFGRKSLKTFFLFFFLHFSPAFITVISISVWIIVFFVVCVPRERFKRVYRNGYFRISVLCVFNRFPPAPPRGVLYCIRYRKRGRIKSKGKKNSFFFSLIRSDLSGVFLQGGFFLFTSSRTHPFYTAAARTTRFWPFSAQTRRRHTVNGEQDDSNIVIYRRDLPESVRDVGVLVYVFVQCARAGREGRDGVGTNLIVSVLSRPFVYNNIRGAPIFTGRPATRRGDARRVVSPKRDANPGANKKAHRAVEKRKRPRGKLI